MMKNEWGMSKGGWGKRLGVPVRAHIPHSPFPTPHSQRPGVTLIELLITMAIMAIISAAILGTASAAMEAARRDRTRVLVTKISNLINEKVASYETRRVDLHQDVLSAVNAIANPRDRGMAMADMRLLAKRELIKCEMPSRWSDFLPPTSATAAGTIILSARPSLAQTYYRRYYSVGASGPSDSYESAECLYLTIMNATGDGEARTLFGKQDIGDFDEDGMPEFLDGWGNPISWIRWPAGVISDLQPADAAGNRLADADHDPFDVYRRDQAGVSHGFPGLPPAAVKEMTALNMRNNSGDVNASAYRLVPLIYSAGGDGDSEIWAAPTITSDLPALDPYCEVEGNFLGATTGTAAKDNITNHLIEY